MLFQAVKRTKQIVFCILLAVALSACQNLSIQEELSNSSVDYQVYRDSIKHFFNPH